MSKPENLKKELLHPPNIYFPGKPLKTDKEEKNKHLLPVSPKVLYCTQVTMFPFVSELLWP